MKTSSPYLRKANDPLRRVGGGCQVLALAALVGAGLNLAICNAQSPQATMPVVQAGQGVKVLTRGPVHEAFAGMVSYNPEPGIIVASAPPALIEEVPPGERPEGNNVTWIPGYWAWDEEAGNFLWVSGTWRALPPGRQWMAGYWVETTQGYQWTSGYWADAAARETIYQAQPPATVEAGPNVAAPSSDYRWTPGNWIWHEDRYAWGPGYWARGRADWDWSPSHYVWTPRGYIFVDGYWDYPVERRGALFAPVCFESGVYSRSGYSYSPSILIDLAVFAEHLFLRPRYNHYYFGDYYAPSYQQGGYLSAFAYQSSNYGYDPIYSHQRWSHRQDQGWNDRMGTSFQYRRDNQGARPPRTWDAQLALADTPAYTQNRMSVGAPLDQMAKRKEGGMRFQTVTQQEKQALAQRGQEVGRFREQRRTQEASGAVPRDLKAGELMAPSRVKQTRSPIVAKSADQLGKGLTPPAAPRAPKPETTVRPTADPTGRQPRGDKPDPRQPGVTPREKQTLPEPRQPGATPREKPAQREPRQPAATPREKPAQPEPRQPAVTPREKQTLPEPRQPDATPREKPAQREPRQPAATPREKPAQPEPRQPAVTPREKPAQPAPRQPAATPREKPAQREPRQPSATPREKPAQPAPRQPAATPRETPAQPAPRQPAATPREKPAQREPRQPAANPAAPRDPGPGQSDEKDRKKKGK